jgi:hypothetical protein
METCGIILLHKVFNLIETKDDGVYKVRTLSHLEKVLQIPCTLTGHYRRYVEDDGKTIIFRKV